MVIYEWADAPYLGKITSMTDEYLPVSRFQIRFKVYHIDSAAENLRLHFRGNSSRILF